MRGEYKIEVTRDGRWWMIHIPDVDGLTQARRLSEVEYMARDYLALVTHTPAEDITVHVASIVVPTLGDVASPAHSIVDMRQKAAEATARAQKESADYAKELIAAGVPVRDVAGLLELSFQRVSQLAAAR